MPAQLYLAVKPDRAAGLALELREWHEQSIVIAFSSLEQFIEGCGADQPWVLVETERLAELADDGEGGFRFGVLLDVSLPVELRGTAGSMVETEASWNDAESADWAVVYVASQPYEPGQDEARVELQPMPGDRLALMIYSSQQSLFAGCGPNQPWVTLPAGLVAEARRQSGAHTICLDTPLPSYLRHGG